MKLTTTLAILASTLVLGSSSLAMAEEDLPMVYKAERPHSVNVSPLGLLIGAYSLNYEYLLGGSHGFMAEGHFYRSSGDDASASNFGGSVGYRWHWRGTQNSGFLGVMTGYAVGHGEATVNDRRFAVDTNLLYVTGNVGKRWAWDSGFNVTIRIGGGYGDWSVTTDDPNPIAQDAVRLVDEILSLLPIYVDGELSIGYTF